MRSHDVAFYLRIASLLSDSVIGQKIITMDACKLYGEEAWKKEGNGTLIITHLDPEVDEKGIVKKTGYDRLLQVVNQGEQKLVLLDEVKLPIPRGV